MDKVITMFAGDREIIRSASSVLALAINFLDSINDGGLGDNKDKINQCIQEIEGVKRILHQIDVEAVTYQLAPGKIRPRS
jgi:hypothetical protein